jgi:transposase
VASVSRWRNLERQQGDARLKALGGDRRSGRIEAHKETILAVLKTTPDLAIEELRRRLAEKGLVFAEGTNRRFLDRYGITRKKKTAHGSEQDVNEEQAHDSAAPNAVSSLVLSLHSIIIFTRTGRPRYFCVRTRGFPQSVTRRPSGRPGPPAQPGRKRPFGSRTGIGFG